VIRLSLFILFLFSATPLSSQGNPIGVVSSAHPLATQAGAEILINGGNAFDAAIAVSSTLSVVEPFGSGLGGGGFFLIYEAASDRYSMIDARERAPLNSTADMYLDNLGNPIPRLSIDGALAAGIPGLPAGLAFLNGNYGMMSFEETLEFAFKTARDGFIVDERLEDRVHSQWERFNDEAKDIFSNPNDEPIAAGEILVQEDLARSISLISESHARDFYEGMLSITLLEATQAMGGIWTAEDLMEYEIIEREPLIESFFGHNIISVPPPSSGGIALFQMLSMLNQLDYFSLNRTDQIHVLIESMRRAYRDRALYLGDSDFIDVPMEMLLSERHINESLNDFDMNRASNSEPMMFDEADFQEGMDTTHFSIIDQFGNIVSATQSINYNFGSGMIASGTGIFLNNEMDDFSIKPGYPNLYGLVGSEANAIAPGKRMLSSMTPTIITSEEDVMAIGTPGGSRIITMVMLAILDWIENKSVEQSVNHLRIHHQYLPDMLQIEPGAINSDAIYDLMERGHEIEELENNFGNMYAAAKKYQENSYSGAADFRGVGSVLIVYD
jgi:gamma-glutamyltranspeptidase/glutathione hydrolase